MIVARVPSGRAETVFRSGDTSPVVHPRRCAALVSALMWPLVRPLIRPLLNREGSFDKQSVDHGGYMRHAVNAVDVPLPRTSRTFTDPQWLAPPLGVFSFEFPVLWNAGLMECRSYEIPEQFHLAIRQEKSPPTKSTLTKKPPVTEVTEGSSKSPIARRPSPSARPFLNTIPAPESSHMSLAA